MTFEEANAPVVTDAAQDATPPVETETTTPSTSESANNTDADYGDETTLDTEPSEADTSDQPVEEVETPRSEKRIQQLLREKKALQEKADYWDQLQARLPEAPVDSDDAEVTVDTIADAVIRKQEAANIQRTKVQAQNALQQDAIDTLAAHPELEEDDDLAAMVVSLAQTERISFKAAADRVKSRIAKAEAQALKKAQATQAQRAGASQPTGGRVSNGSMPAPNLSNMSDDEKASNWNQIISSYR